MYVAECSWLRAVFVQVSEPFCASAAVVSGSVKQALSDSKSLLLRRLNPASQPCFAWLCPFIVETNNEGPNWDICLLTLSFTSICTLRTTLSCYMSAHCWICICGTSGKAQCRECSKADRDCSKAKGRMNTSDPEALREPDPWRNCASLTSWTYLASSAFQKSHFAPSNLYTGMWSLLDLKLSIGNFLRGLVLVLPETFGWWLSVVRLYIMLMFTSSRLVYYPFADSSHFLTVTLILGSFILLSNLQVCAWQESTSSVSRAVLPQVEILSALEQFLSWTMFLGSRPRQFLCIKQALVFLEYVTWQQGTKIIESSKLLVVARASCCAVCIQHRSSALCDFG